MSTIPAGLRADLMRNRMEDKATIQTTGSLYVGGTSPVTYYDEHGNPLSRFITEMLEPGDAGKVLMSNGANTKPSYQTVGTNSIADNAVSYAKLGTGTIVPSDSTHQYVLNVERDANDTNVLVIQYYVNA